MNNVGKDFMLITKASKGALAALKAAFKEPSDKRFVLTSSSSAAVLSNPDLPAVTVTKDSYIHEAIKNVAGVQFTILFLLVMTATFVPKGAFSLNPKMLSDEDLDSDAASDGMGWGNGVDDDTKSLEMELRRSNSSR